MANTLTKKGTKPWLNYLYTIYKTKDIIRKFIHVLFSGNFDFIKFNFPY